jgi:alpha-beta hydrolase superfamily lysophospholipase
MNDQRVFFSDDFYDGQFVRTVASAPSGLADLGEAFAAARAVGNHPTPERWHAAWWARAGHAHDGVEQAGRAGHRVTARGAHLRASEYARQSYFFLRHDLSDKRLRAAHRLHVDAFQAAVELMDHPARPVAIPYDATTIKGYLYAPVADGRRRPTILMPAGYDSTAESGWSDVPVALAHGYNALVFEGPGQGASLYDDHLVFRPDFEHVLTQVVDWLIGDASVDPAALVLCGRSFAGYLAPRAATVEHRLAALVCDPAQPDLSARLPEGLVGKVAAPVVEFEIRHDADKAEFFGSRMAAHGVTTVTEYFDVLRTYTMLDDAAKITCPTLIIESEGDPVGGGGKLLMDHLTCPATYVPLTAAEGAGGHCAGLGQRVWADAVYPWLADTLANGAIAALSASGEGCR